MADALTGSRLAVVAVADNGWQPAEIVELAMVHIDDGAVVRGPLVWTVRPERLPSTGGLRARGVPFGRVAQGPPWSEVAEQVTEALSGRVLVAFDLPHAYRLLQRHLPDWRPPRVVDVHALARLAWPELRVFDLPHLMIRAGVHADRLAGRSPTFEVTATVTVLLAIVRSGAVPAGYLTGERRL